MEFTPVILVSILLGFGLFAVQVSVAVVAVSSWDETRAHMRPSALLASVVLVLGLPATVVSLVYLDPTAASGELPRGMAGIMVWITRLAILFGTGLNVFLTLMQLPVALRLGEPHPFPLLLRRPQAGGGLALSATLGAVLGGISVALFYVLDVDPGQIVETVRKMVPGVDMEAPGYVLGVSLPAVIGIAATEELLFRGIIQRWLDGRLAAVTGGSWIAIGLSSFVWALGHLANVEQAGLKVAQIFLLGLLFGYLTKRFSVEASIAAHVGLNFVAVLVPVFLRLAGMQ